MSGILCLISALFFLMTIVKLAFVERRIMTVEEVLLTAILYALFALYEQNKESKS